MRKKIRIGFGSYLIDRILIMLMAITLLIEAVGDKSWIGVIAMVVSLLSNLGSLAATLLYYEYDDDDED